MMNLLALSLVLASLASAGLFSPNPETHAKRQGETTISKEDHRVVVEYDQDGHHSTKISITPEDKFTDVDSSVSDDAKGKIKEAASVLPEGGSYNQNAPFPHASTELICDAYGKCKHKISDAMGKAKDKISETAKEAIDKQKEMADEFIAKKKEELHMARDAVGKAKKAISHKAHEVKESTKDTIKDAKDIGETIRDHIVRNVSEEVRDVKEGMKYVLGYLKSIEAVSTLFGVLNLMGLSTAYGLCVWVTFFSSYVLSRAMPRQQFGMVQSKIYPVYFRTMAYCIGMALLGHILTNRKRVLSGKAEMLQVHNLLLSLFTVLINSIYLEPRATKVMFERIKIEKEEGRGREDITTEPRRATPELTESAPTATTAGTTATGAAATAPAEQDKVRYRIIRLNEKLKKLNSYSSLLNIMTLMSLSWHLVYLAQCLHHTAHVNY